MKGKKGKGNADWNAVLYQDWTEFYYISYFTFFWEEGDNMREIVDVGGIWEGGSQRTSRWEMTALECCVIRGLVWSIVFLLSVLFLFQPFIFYNFINFSGLGMLCHPQFAVVSPIVSLSHLMSWMVSKRRIASGTKRRVRTYVHIYVFPSFPTTSGWSATEQIDLHSSCQVV